VDKGENVVKEDNQIYVNQLVKKYSNGYVAIKGISFSVEMGEIFGLLGPNGAGKSTTFNIVTAGLPKTSGDVKILNQYINNGIMDIFEEFGVCPQYDSIYEAMTT
jgi:ATP-binding cassette subfamily A (ABC1) protein 3